MGTLTKGFFESYTMKYSVLSLIQKPDMDGFNQAWQNTFGGNAANQGATEEVPPPANVNMGAVGDENINVDAAAIIAGDEHDQTVRGNDSSSSSRRGQYARHTPYQIQELEAYFKENPHPNERQRLAISKKLNIEVNKVKFWFQNRRTQLKAQLERHDNAILKQENEKLRLENMAMKEALRNCLCKQCGGQAPPPSRSLEEHKLIIENARLRDELAQMSSLVQSLSGRPTTSAVPALGSMNPNYLVEEGLVGRASSSGVIPGEHGNGYLELALKATDELLKLGSVNAPLWERNTEGGGETLDFYEYIRAFSPLLGSKPLGFVSDASRASAMVSVPSLALVETLLDPNRWREMFVGLIGSSTTMEVLSGGTGDSRNGVLQIMNAEIQLVSPLVPVRVLKFIRYCHQTAERMWVVVDVSINDGMEGAMTRRLPSGCILQEMPNGFSKVTWIEHTEYDEYQVSHQYRRLLRSGMGFGAQRWICALLRHFECLRAIASPTGNNQLSPNMRSGLRGLAQRMTSLFCAGVCLTGGQRWELVAQAPGSPRIMLRNEPTGTIVTATSSAWIPATHRDLFDLLLNRDVRSAWDVLCHGNAVGIMIHLPLAQEETSPNSISVLSSTTMADESSIMLLQETSSDMTGSLIVYASMDFPTVSAVISGGDLAASVALLPSGLCIVPGYGEQGGEQGSMVTVGFQVLLQDVGNSNLPVDTISTINDLVSRTVRGIEEIVRSSQQ